MHFTCDKFNITPRMAFAGTRGSVGAESVSLDLSSDWDGLAVRLCFYPADGSTGVTVACSGEPVDVPSELTTVAGIGRMTVVGTQGDVVLISLSASLIVEEVPQPADAQPAPPTATEYAQLRDLINVNIGAAEEIQTAAETAQTGAETAQSAAEAAQTAAETAQTGAESAQSAAEAAQSAAEAAQTAAETARTGAEAAQAAAEEAAAGAGSGTGGGGTGVAEHDASPAAHADLFAAKADKLAAGSYTKGNILVAGEGGTFVDSFYPVFMDVITEPVYLQNATRSGKMRYIADVGDSFEVSRGDSALTFDIIGIDHDTPADAQYAHSTTVQLHDCCKYMTFDAKELLFYVNPTDCPDGLAAGTYNFTLDHGAFGGVTGEDGTYQFTTTQTIPAGGGFRHSTAGTYHSGNSYTQSNITGGTVITYDASGGELESGLAVTLGSDGTALGTFSAREPAYRSSENCNYTERCAYGNGGYEHSALRQWLNSDAAAGSVWTAKTVFDLAPSWAATEAGFLNGLDADFLAVLGAPVKRTARNTCTDGGGYVDISTDKVFLLSCGEVGGLDEGGVSEGTPYEYYASMLTDGERSNGALAGRVKYQSGIVRAWWLRSLFSSLPGSPRNVYQSGNLSSAYAHLSQGVAPGCCII